MTPVFAHGHLRLYLLHLLGESPMHGYDLMQALGDRFDGTYRPSAGTIYPRLARLEQEGLVTKESRGRKTVYAITDAGRAELAERQSDLAGVESEVTDSVRRLADEVRASVDQATKTLRSDLAAATRDARQAARDAAQGARRNTVGDAPSDAISSSSPPGPTRTEPGPTRAETALARALNRNRLGEIEVLLAEFRHDVRTELRQQASRSQLTDRTVAALREQLTEARRAITERARIGERRTPAEPTRDPPA